MWMLNSTVYNYINDGTLVRGEGPYGSLGDYSK